ncbi:MAG: hypothetical protein J1F12_00920, partial [Muribaculaceae bacterium]|nr:hypothetical protein [Muribaculaceae bacterium]
MTPPQITEGIKSFLSIPHTGAIVISGPWGSGKSYYVKNQLKKEIANTPYLPTNKVEEKEGTFSKKVKNIVKKHLPAEDKYYPIMFSVFGLSSLSEVQNKLTTTFLGEVSDGSSDKLGYIFKGVKNTISSIPKLNEWLDTEKIFDPKILSFLFTPNMVIIIDDLERLNTDKIPFQDFLGFINDLSENNGYKVILLSNHSFLLEKNKDNLEFHEKAVEKTLNFEADIISIIENIAREIGGESFAEFIKGQQPVTEHILSHFYDYSPLERGKIYANLRTVKFALNHFYEIFKNRKKLDEEYADFILRDSWFQILSVALEYKEALSYDE